MARLPRVVAPGLPHRVTQRGNRRQRTFFKDEDYAEYCGLLADPCRSCATQVLAYCLMRNHVHLIMVPADEFGLRDALGEAHRRYTRMVNFREGWKGHLWQRKKPGPKAREPDRNTGDLFAEGEWNSRSKLKGSCRKSTVTT